MDGDQQAEWVEMKARLSSTTEEDDLCEQCSRKREQRRNRLKKIKSSAAETPEPVRTELKSESSSFYRRPPAASEVDTREDRLTEDLLRYSLSPISASAEAKVRNSLVFFSLPHEGCITTREKITKVPLKYETN